jgi:hypothetical protein
MPTKTFKVTVSVPDCCGNDLDVECIEDALKVGLWKDGLVGEVFEIDSVVELIEREGQENYDKH